MDAETLHTLLTEMQTRLEHPLEYMRPVEGTFKDPLGREGETLKYGVVRKMTCDITEEIYLYLKMLPKPCVLRGLFWLEEEGEGQPVVTTKPKKASKPAKGPHGKFWQEMFLEGIIGRADFQQWTGVQPGLVDWEKTVRAIFEQDSLTFVSPEMLLKWLREQAGPDRLKNLLKAIEDIAKTGEPDFPPDQYFSPFDLGARKPAQMSDNQFLQENQLP